MNNSRKLYSLIYRLRNKGYRIDTKSKTIFLKAAPKQSFPSDLATLRKKFGFALQLELPGATASSRVYISGPIAHYDLEDRKEVFRDMECLLRRNGYIPVNPFNNGLPQPGDWQDHMKADIKLLLNCQYIVLLPGWEKSKGCRLELDVAMSTGLEVLNFG
jgi:hypothetical protein